jgi:hypothetical protein
MARGWAPKVDAAHHSPPACLTFMSVQILYRRLRVAKIGSHGLAGSISLIATARAAVQQSRGEIA